MPHTHVVYRAKAGRPLAMYRRMVHWRRSVPYVFLLTHHKTGTVLFLNAFRRIASHLNVSMSIEHGQVSRLPDSSRVILFPHSLIDKSVLGHRFRGVHVRRDPRDIIVSGYLYHKRCKEPWCIAVPPRDVTHMSHAVIPYQREHYSDEWKQDYIRRLGNKSYQQNLLERNEEEGLIWEMENCGAWTIEDLLAWDYAGDARILEITLEDVVSAFDAQFAQVLKHIGFSDALTSECVSLIQPENLSSMGKDRIERHPHISASSLSKWREYFTDKLEHRFRELFPNAVEQLGYEWG